MNDLDSFLAELGINNNDNTSNIRAFTPENPSGVIASASAENAFDSETVQNANYDINVDIAADTPNIIQAGDGLVAQLQRMDEHPEEYEINTSDLREISSEMLEEIAREVFGEAVVQRSSQELRSLAEEANSVSVNTASSTETQQNNDVELRPITVQNDDSARFSGAEWFNAIQNTSASIIGLGGIGSWLALLLSRLKLRFLYLRDMDTVEQINLSGQLYATADIGLKKTDSLRGTIYKFNTQRPCIYTDATEFNENSSIPWISDSAPAHNVFLGLDSITARRNVYNSWKWLMETVDKEYIFIDGRLTADKWQIFAIPSKDKKRMEVYEKEWLFPESEAQHLPCSFKQTTYMASMIASYMCNLFVNFVAESTKPLVPYSIPFMTEFDAQTFEMKTYECD